MNLKKINDKLLTAYSQETSQPYDGLWSPDNPAKGHCAVVSMIIQDYFGGKIIRCFVDDPEQVVHYYNSTTKGDIDLTWGQFSEHCVKYAIRPAAYEEYVFSDTLLKYKMLKDRAGL